jgi:hypothetical protein
VSVQKPKSFSSLIKPSIHCHPSLKMPFRTIIFGMLSILIFFPLAIVANEAEQVCASGSSLPDQANEQASDQAGDQAGDQARPVAEELTQAGILPRCYDKCVNLVV